MDEFIHNTANVKGMKYVIFVLKALLENSVETGKPNYVDMCPVNTILTHNYVDGWRSRLSAKTTANLSRHFFLSGYYGRGWGSKKNYYNVETTYSLNPKKYLPHEFPRRMVTFQSANDVCSPSDRFLDTDKDNLIVAMKWAKANKMMFYNRQQVTFDYETDWGLKATLNGKVEKNEACGDMSFATLDSPKRETFNKLGNNEFMKTTEVTARLRYAPGETYINNKQRRRVINLDAPVFTVSHTLGVRGVLGGEYSYNYTEASIYKRFWLKSWGKMDFKVKGGIEWEKVPFPLLIMPETNLSYIVQDYTFEAINNMEFPTDRFLSGQLYWDMNGKILNRIPLIRKLKWREWIGFRILWGELSEKNNPYLDKNANNPLLMYFPEGSYVIDPKRPYMELSIGVHNIFKIVHVEYVRRLNYNDLPTAHKDGIRFMVRATF
jgi:hypothetical protein